MNESFKEYMNENLPTWETNLSMVQINDIKESYDKLQEIKKRIDDIFKKSLSTKAGSDYTTDLQKTTNEQIEAKKDLQEKII